MTGCRGLGISKHLRTLGSFRRLFLLSSLICFFVTLSYQAAANQNRNTSVQPVDSVAIDNEYFKVMFNSTSCTQAHTPGFGSRVIVALAKTKIKSSRGKIQLKRGEVAVFSAEESYSMRQGEFFEVAFKTDHPALKKPEQWIEPRKNKIIFTNDEFRIFQERLAAGDDRELHSHAQRIVVRLNKVQLTDPRYHENGLPGNGWQIPNTVKFAEPVVHAVRNLSRDTELFNIVIEFNVQS